MNKPMESLRKSAAKLIDNPAVYPVCFAMLPIMSGYADTLGEFLPRDAILLCLISALTAFASYLLLGLILKDKHQAAMCLWILILAFFTYADISRYVKSATGVLIHTFPRPYLAVLYLGAIGIILLILKRAKLFWWHHTVALNVVAVCLCLINLGIIAEHEINLAAAVHAISASFVQQDSPPLVSAQPGAKPDIYLIVLDEFANSSTLKEYYRFDNSDFERFLADKGFHVEDSSVSNYDRTVLSFCSFLNLGYLTEMVSILHGERPTASPYFKNGPLTGEQAGCAPIFRATQDSVAFSLLKQAGYRLVNVCSGYGATDYLVRADENVGGGFRNRFDTGLLSSTVLRCLDGKFHLLRSLYAANSMAIFRSLPAVVAEPGPKFVLAHSLVCHEPYIFDEQGNELPIPHTDMEIDEHRRRYLTQLKFAESKVKVLIDTLLQNPGPKPVIVLISDHGPRPFWLTEGWSPQYVNEHFKNLMAFYFPDGDYRSLGPSMSDVNVLRVVFNKYLGTRYPMLPDRCYVVPDGGPWRQFDVTKMVSLSQPVASSP